MPPRIDERVMNNPRRRGLIRLERRMSRRILFIVSLLFILAYKWASFSLLLQRDDGNMKGTANVEPKKAVLPKRLLDAMMPFLNNECPKHKAFREEQPLLYRDFCLPRIICELASRTPEHLTRPQHKFLEMFDNRDRSVANSFVMAKDYGEMFRYARDELARSNGACQQLWHGCPLMVSQLLKGF